MPTLQSNTLPFAVALVALPIAIFGAYIAWLIVPTIVQAVVPAVVCAVAGA